MASDYQEEDLISLNSPVVLRKLVKGRRFFYRQETVRYGRVSVKGSQLNLADAIGHPYGTLFRVENQRLVPVEDAAEFDQFEGQVVSGLSGPQPAGRDNRNISDTSDNQKLKESDLCDLRQAGESGRQVIQQLIGHSASFEHKTSFSQEKYVRKKKEKYLDYVSVLRPSARVLSELRGRGLNLRVDMLSQLLAYANVHYESRVLLLDDTHNQLLSHAVCERLTGSGRLCLLGGNQADLCERVAPALRLRHRRLRLHAVPLSQLSGLLARRQAAAAAAADCPPSPKRPRPATPDAGDAGDAKAARRAELSRRLADDQEALASNDWDCLIVASKFSPLSLAPLLRLLLPGRPFAFYSPYQDPLLALAARLKADGCLLAPVLFDSFLRKYQIMQDRCRPQLRMVASSGYALVARVCRDAGTPDEVAADSDEAS